MSDQVFESRRAQGLPAVKLDHVCKAFGDQKVLEDLCLEVRRGRALCLTGRSGAGKSVTLKMMVGLIKPDKGEVVIQGVPLQLPDKHKLWEVRKHIGFLFQAGALFDSISVADNVAFPLRRHTKKPEREIQELVNGRLKDVGLEAQGKKMPSELSGGMKLRAGLARALVLQPDMLLIDEPSSGLDRITAGEIYGLLAGIKEMRNVTTVIVTHDVNGAKPLADEFAVLDRGRIIARGSVDELAGSDNPLVRDLIAGSEVPCPKP